MKYWILMVELLCWVKYLEYVFIFTLVTCSRPLPPPNGFFSHGSLYNSYVGHRVAYGCDYGYRLIGSATIVCQNDGTWNAPVPTCEQGRSDFHLNY